MHDGEDGVAAIDERREEQLGQRLAEELAVDRLVGRCPPPADHPDHARAVGLHLRVRLRREHVHRQRDAGQTAVNNVGFTVVTWRRRLLGMSPRHCCQKGEQRDGDGRNPREFHKGQM